LFLLFKFLLIFYHLECKNSHIFLHGKQKSRKKVVIYQHFKDLGFSLSFLSFSRLFFLSSKNILHNIKINAKRKMQNENSHVFFVNFFLDVGAPFVNYQYILTSIRRNQKDSWSVINEDSKGRNALPSPSQNASRRQAYINTET